MTNLRSKKIVQKIPNFSTKRQNRQKRFQNGEKIVQKIPNLLIKSIKKVGHKEAKMEKNSPKISKFIAQNRQKSGS